MLLALPLALSLAACAGLPERRDGYQVDHSYRATGYNSRIRHLVLHYTSHGEQRALATLTGPHVSSHYLVPVPRQANEPPRVYQLVPEHERAWHAGVSVWGLRSNINDTSIGIEIINDGPVEGSSGLQWSAFPPAQMKTVAALLKDLSERYQIEPLDILGHSDIAPQRKIDPGPAFPWEQLYRAGIGSWPDAETVQRYQSRFKQVPPSLPAVQAALAVLGYPIQHTAEADAQTCAVLRAFQMRYRPTDYRGAPDLETVAILWALLEKYRPASLPTLAELQPLAEAAAWAGWSVSCPAVGRSVDRGQQHPFGVQEIGEHDEREADQRIWIPAFQRLEQDDAQAL